MDEELKRLVELDKESQREEQPGECGGCGKCCGNAEGGPRPQRDCPAERNVER